MFNLNFSYTKITDSSFKYFRNIKLINLSSCNQITDNGL